MDWIRLLAYITGTVDQELLRRNEYLLAENSQSPNPVKSGQAKIPLFGTISAGFPQDASQEPRGFIEVDFKELNFTPTMRTFALKVCGDEMRGRHILDGDVVVLEHGLKPRDGDVVAALVNNQSLIRSFVVVNGKPCLKAEHPQHPHLLPANDLVIQGVMLTLLRKSR